jgi:WD40 repeat protein/tRNA A-37 threonylcarbamoyl transferase component Bud32/Flp pilus assembly protein TadD
MLQGVLDTPAGPAPGTIRIDPGSPEPAQETPSFIGGYQILEEIGSGGMGVVYLAEQKEPVRRRVALKIIKLGMDTKQVIARFEVERQALALMDHSNIAKVLDAGATETGRPYFVMELVRGLKITDYCDQHSLSTVERLNLFIPVCRAVQHAHQKGVIHRDLKPSNILVTVQDGVPIPKIIDFGIAKATGQSLTDKTIFTAFEQIIGTPAYMSPEQAEMGRLDIDTRTDIYSLGVVLYELLTGRTPFETKDLLRAGLEAMRRMIREEEPPRPSTRLTSLTNEELGQVAKRRKAEPPKLINLLRGDLDWIAMKALEKERARRYETANGLAMDVERHLCNEAVLARPPSNLYRFQKLAQRHKVVLAAAAAVLLALILGISATSWQAWRASQAEREQANLREKSDDNALRAATEARLARGAAVALKIALAASEFAQAQSLISEGHRSQALVYLSKSLSDNPTNQEALIRLADLLANSSWPMPGPALKHSNSVSSALFSPDGQSIVTASEDGTAQIWEARTGQPLAAPMKHSAAVKSARFSPDGTKIVTASDDHTARVWDTRTGQPVGEPMRHEDQVQSAQFSPDGKRIVTASSDNTARVWDAQTGQPLTGPIKHNSDVSSAEFSPDGSRLLTGCYDDLSARVWDARSGQPLTEPMKQVAGLSSAHFSPDGAEIVTASTSGPVRVRDAQTGQSIIVLTNNPEQWVYSAQFSPDSHLILTASEDHTARLWDAKTGELLKSFWHESAVVSAQFSPDGRWIATASKDNTARAWNARTGEPLTEPLRHESEVVSAHFGPDGTRVVTASRDGTARIWAIGNTRMQAQTLLAPSDPASAQNGPHSSIDPHNSGNWPVGVGVGQFSRDGSRFVSASGGNVARVWQVQTGQPISGPMSHNGQVLSTQFSPDGTSVVTASEDGTARVWNASTGHPLTPPIRHAGEVWFAQFSPDGRRIVTACKDQTARVWDATTGEPLTPPLQHHSPVRCARFSPDGAKIVTAAEHDARIWDATNGKLLGEPLKHNDNFIVFSAQFSPDGQRIATAGWDYTARLWNARTGQPLGQPLKHNNWVASAQFSPDGQRLVTASFDNTARIWDAHTGQPLTEPLKHNYWVYSAQFSPEGQSVLTASSDGVARIWDARTGQPLTEPMKNIKGFCAAQFSPDGLRIAASANDGTTQMWEVVLPDSRHPDWLLTLAEIVSGHTVNQDGVFEPTLLNRAQALDDLRQKLNVQTDNDPWTGWGRWFLADCHVRTISPNSKITMSQFIEQSIKFPTGDALNEAEELAAGSGETLGRIADARAKLDRANRLDASERQVLQSGLQPAPWLEGEEMQLTSKMNGVTVGAWRHIVWAGQTNGQRIWRLMNDSGAGDYSLGEAQEDTFRPIHSQYRKVRQDVLVDTTFQADHAEVKRLDDAAARRVELDGPVFDNDQFFQLVRRLPLKTGYKIRLPLLHPNNSGIFLWEIEVGSLETVTVPAGIYECFKLKPFSGQTYFYSTDPHHYLVKFEGGGAVAELSAVRQLTEIQCEEKEMELEGGVLAERGKLAEAEIKFGQGLALAPQTSSLYFSRGDCFARLGRWKEAAADFSKAVEFAPDDHLAYHLLVPALVQGGDLPAYRLCCAQILARFGRTNDPTVCARMAKDCLLLPSSEIDLTAVSKLAQTAVTTGTANVNFPNFAYVKGLVEYRSGNFASAVEWTRKALAAPFPVRDVQANLVLAMAQQRLNRADDARAALAAGIAGMETGMPKLESGDLGGEWYNWVIARALLREAKALLEESPSVKQSGH